MYNKPYLQRSRPNEQVQSTINVNRTIYYGRVVSIDDNTDGGAIKVFIPDLDNFTSDSDLPWCYPLLPKFFHIYPQINEVVRILLEDNKFPQRSRYWLGSVISQPHKIGFDSCKTALSTTNYGAVQPDRAPSTYPDAQGVYPLKTDVALVGKVNTDIILRDSEVHIRAGKHENGSVLKLNTTNPADISMTYEIKPSISDTKTVTYYSNTVIMSDKIAIISHTGDPQYRAARVTAADRTDMFNTGHPMVRGDVLIEALNVIKDALINHIHGYSAISAEKTEVITKLEKLELELMLQPNIVIN